MTPAPRATAPRPPPPPEPEQPELPPHMRRAGARRPGPRSARARRGHGHHGECGARPGGRRGPGLALRRRQLRPGARQRSVPARRSLCCGAAGEGQAQLAPAAPSPCGRGSVRDRGDVGGVGVSPPAGAHPSALTFICHCPPPRAAPPGALGARGGSRRLPALLLRPWECPCRECPRDAEGPAPCSPHTPL